MKYDSKECEKNAIMRVAENMVAAARTAPKACGQDHLEFFIIDGEEKDALAKKMREIGSADEKKSFFVRDAGNVEISTAVVLLGLKNVTHGRDCGYCNCETCAEAINKGVICTYGITDLGIATGRAAAEAGASGIDNRIMYSVGYSALELGFFSKNVVIAWGIPLSTSGKSPYFDRQ